MTEIFVLFVCRMVWWQLARPAVSVMGLQPSLLPGTSTVLPPRLILASTNLNIHLNIQRQSCRFCHSVWHPVLRIRIQELKKFVTDPDPDRTLIRFWIQAKTIGIRQKSTGIQYQKILRKIKKRLFSMLCVYNAKLSLFNQYWYLGNHLNLVIKNKISPFILDLFSGFNGFCQLSGWYHFIRIRIQPNFWYGFGSANTGGTSTNSCPLIKSGIRIKTSPDPPHW